MILMWKIIQLWKWVKNHTTYDNTLVKQPPTADSAFHFPMEGHVGSSNWVDHPFDDTEGIDYGPNAPFWRTYMG